MQTTVSHMEQRISLVTLGVTDLSRARAFYEALGWSGAQQPDDEVCFFQAGGMVFGLWTALGGHGAPGIELAHNVRSPQEVGTVLAEAERAGASLCDRPREQTGAAPPEHSPTRTVTCGRSLTTPAGFSAETGLSRSSRPGARAVPAACPSTKPLTAIHGHSRSKRQRC